MFKRIKRLIKNKAAATKAEPHSHYDTEKVMALVALLSDNDGAVLELLALYNEGAMAEFWSKAEALFDEGDVAGLRYTDAANAGIVEIAKEILEYRGYIVGIDWKAPFEDLLFVAKKSLAHYGIDPSVYDDVPDQDMLQAPDALEVMASRLPEGFGMGFWDYESDSYQVIIGKKSTLKAAEALGKELGLPIFADWRDCESIGY